MADESEPPISSQPPRGVIYAESSPPQTGWLPPRPPAEKRRDWLRPFAIGCGVAAVLFLAGPLVFLAIYNLSSTADSSPRAIPAVQAVQVGQGGFGCAVTTTGTSFPEGTPVRVVATFSPNLPTGSSVLIKLHRDGMELTSRREILRIDEPADCIYSEYPDLAAGRYRIEYELESSAMPPLSGEFDITAH